MTRKQIKPLAKEHLLNFPASLTPPHSAGLWKSLRNIVSNDNGCLPVCAARRIKLDDSSSKTKGSVEFSEINRVFEDKTYTQIA